MKPRVYHIARRIRADGAVSAWCYSKDRAIDLKRASWTLLVKTATCAKCIDAFREANGPDATSALFGRTQTTPSA